MYQTKRKNATRTIYLPIFPQSGDILFYLLYRLINPRNCSRIFSRELTMDERFSRAVEDILEDAGWVETFVVESERKVELPKVTDTTFESTEQLALLHAKILNS